MKTRNFKWLIAFSGAIIVVLLLRGFVFTSCLIPYSGMENSLFQGERILVNKWSYGLRVPFMNFFSYQRWGDKPLEKEDIVVFNNPGDLHESVIDQKGLFISRCIGVPGDTLLIDSLFRIVSAEGKYNPDKKHLFTYPASKEKTLKNLLISLSLDDEGLMGSNDTIHVRSFSRYEYYLLDQTMTKHHWLHPTQDEENINAKPLIIPSKGKAVKVYPWNITLLRNTLVLHENKQAEIKNDTLYVDGRPTQHCFFTKDYYWMSSNNTVNLCDSRLFGFVPKDHIVGKASLIWFSKQSGTGLLDGYRWNRFFQTIK